MKTNLTIILFLKERKDFNKRFIDYFLEHNLGFNLLISDGSKKTDKNLLNRIKKNNLIKYVKFPEDKSYEIFYKKIFKTLKLVKTKYVFFTSNDDFIIYPTLKKYFLHVQSIQYFAPEYLGIHISNNEKILLAHAKYSILCT